MTNHIILLSKRIERKKIQRDGQHAHSIANTNPSIPLNQTIQPVEKALTLG